jgi:hypothetical protein
MPNGNLTKWKVFPDLLRGLWRKLACGKNLLDTISGKGHHQTCG